MEVVHAVRMSIKFPLFLSPFLIYLLQAYFDLVDLQVRAALGQNKKKVLSTLFSRVWRRQLLEPDMPLVQSWEDFFTRYVHGMVLT